MSIISKLHNVVQRKNKNSDAYYTDLHYITLSYAKLPINECNMSSNKA